jgi:hypothetical protein
LGVGAGDWEESTLPRPENLTSKRFETKFAIFSSGDFSDILKAERAKWPGITGLASFNLSLLPLSMGAN